VATFLQVRPPSSAAEVNDVTISHGPTEVALKFGTEDTCVITTRTSISGDVDRVADAIEATSTSARQAGFVVTTGGINPAPGLASYDLILSQEFTLSDFAVGPENCSTEQLIEEHRGRSTLELPAWARGMLAAAAGTAIYLAVVFATSALFTFLAPEFFIYGEIVGGCLAGFASTFVANLINQVPQDANLTQSAVQCVAGAILNVTLGPVKLKLVDTLRDALHTGRIAAVVEEAAGNVGSGSALRESSRYFDAQAELALELADLGEGQP
jgi:hypothetical protein